jgi:histidine ammonia-lyase
MSFGMGDAVIEIGPDPLGFDQVEAVARHGARVGLTDQALKLIGEPRATGRC